MKKLALLGGTGFLGSYLAPRLTLNGYQVVRIGRSYQCEIIADITNEVTLRSAFEATKPDVIINLAANVDVDGCESDIDGAFRINASPNEVIRAYLENNEETYAIYTSSDHVYDSAMQSPEDDVNIRNVYARSKLQGELNITNSRAVSLRTNFFGQPKDLGKKSFLNWIVEAQEKSEATLFKDVYFSPLDIHFLVDCIVAVANKRKLAGIYNLGASNQISKLDFGLTFLNLKCLGTKGVIPVSYEDMMIKKRLTQRPLGMGMDSKKFKKEMNIVLPTVEESIGRLVLGSSNEEKL